MTAPRSLATLLLTSRAVDSDVSPLVASEFWRLTDVVGDPADLLGATAGEVADRIGGAPEDAARVASLLDRGSAFAFTLERLANEGIGTVAFGDPEYPRRLRDRLGVGAPTHLHHAGPVALTETDGIGVVGSGAIDGATAEVAHAAGREVAAAGVPVVSGGDPAVDDIAMRAAVEAEGTTVGVLADALRARVRSADWRRVVLDGTACLCTPYPPDAPATSARARGRSKIVYALSRVTVVVACEPDDDMAAGAADAIDHGWTRVAVWRGPGEGPGNAALEARGATPVTDVAALV